MFTVYAWKLRNIFHSDENETTKLIRFILKSTKAENETIIITLEVDFKMAVLMKFLLVLVSFESFFQYNIAIFNVC